MLRQPGIPGRHVAAQTVIKECQRRIPQRLRHATVKGLGDAARDYVEVIASRAEKLKYIYSSLFSLAKDSSCNIELHE
ncbi:hypothetical protein, partial [Desulfovibrio piger]|uniref:hypothetical protein n=1 Tax=Desulfovibrio piger TaxID=901 RepID=UPI0026F328A8